ncbi:PREDICTED: uncharacterized protein LOC109133116 [Camelina sativa]|uniref:Uncharacterized protein LOC109133116 n=1 Tax=Camelina sativa TaxID=90675 RepID=A0ABM1RRE4_CAMSA|nr:PREDICTED: uncharacterized protein LOC109133116 [Camelina sativa]
MGMEQSLTPIKEAATAEQVEASVMECFNRLADMATLVRRTETRMDSRIDGLGDKIGAHDQQLLEIGRKLDLLLHALPGKSTVHEIGGSSQDYNSRSPFQSNQGW